MALCIVQINITSWINNRYIFQCELSNLNPDIILINETGIVPNGSLKLRGFRSITKALENRNSGVAILIKNNISFIQIPTTDNNTLAIKIPTTIGEIVVCTSYIPPRIPTLPIIQYNKILNFNLPTIIAADLNAHHPFLHNNTRHTPSDNKGKTLFNLAQNRRLKFMGPLFETYKQANSTGKPDVVLTNHLFNILHCELTSGPYVGSSHIPVVIRVSTTPIKILIPEKINLKTLNIQNYKQELSQLNLPSLNHQPISKIDEYMETLFAFIKTATSNNSTTTKIKFSQTYIPTPRIKLKLRQLQAATSHYHIHGYPNLETLHRIKQELLLIIYEDNKKNWDSLVQEAVDCHGNPTQFWHKN